MLGLSMLTGCNLLDGEKDWLGRQEAPETFDGETPKKLVAIWSNSVINQLGQRATRGLGGRIYFYNDEHKPIKVDGDLIVYVYDDSAPEGKKRKEATRKFKFSSEELASKLSMTQIGPSYSVWVPWDEVGGEKTYLSMIPVFTDAQGQLVVGQQARHLLPGKEPTQLAKRDESRPPINPAVSTAAFNAPPDMQPHIAQTSAASQARKRSTRSTRIQLPRSVQQRLSMPLPKKDKSRLKKPTAAMPTGQPQSSESEAANEVTTAAHPLPPARLSPPRRPVRTSQFARQDRDLELKTRGLSIP
jgi:hypothetical protein